MSVPAAETVPVANVAEDAFFVVEVVTTAAAVVVAAAFMEREEEDVVDVVETLEGGSIRQ